MEKVNDTDPFNRPDPFNRRDLFTMWRKPIYQLVCPKCQGMSYMIFFAASILSGTLFSVRTYCPHCGVQYGMDRQTHSHPSKLRGESGCTSREQLDTRFESLAELIEVCLARAAKDGDAKQPAWAAFWEDWKTVIHGHDAEACAEAIKRHPHLFDQLAEAAQTEHICEVAVTENPGFFKSVRKELRSAALRTLAISGNPENIQYITDPTEEESCLAVSAKPHVLKFISAPSPAVCELAVHGDPWALCHVPEKLQTPELCTYAVSAEPKALQYVKHQTPALCLLAVRQWDRCLAMVREQTPEIVRAALARSPAAAKYVKDRSMLSDGS
jgi:hypothetical protein